MMSLFVVLLLVPGSFGVVSECPEGKKLKAARCALVEETRSYELKLNNLNVTVSGIPFSNQAFYAVVEITSVFRPNSFAKTTMKFRPDFPFAQRCSPFEQAGWIDAKWAFGAEDDDKLVDLASVSQSSLTAVGTDIFAFTLGTGGLINTFAKFGIVEVKFSFKDDFFSLENKASRVTFTERVGPPEAFDINGETPRSLAYAANDWFQILQQSDLIFTRVDNQLC